MSDRRLQGLAVVAVVWLSGCSAGLAQTPPTPSRVSTPSGVPRPAPSASPAASPLPVARIDHLNMLNARVGWGLEVGGAGPVVRTEDGGRSWRAFSPVPGSSVSKIYAHTENLAWVVALDSSPVLRVARTRDAGATWLASDPLPLYGAAKQLDFADADHGWLLGERRSDKPGDLAVPLLLRTTDGGATWLQASSPPASCQVYSVAFLDATTGWLAGGFCGEKSYLLASRDGGESWSAQPFPTAVVRAPAGNGTVKPVTLIDPPVFWTVGDGVFVYREGYTTGANALQYSTLYLTHDGGATWSAIGLPATPLSAQDFRHGPMLWFVGSGPSGDTENLAFYRSVDGGTHWEKVADRTPRFSAIQFPDSSLGIGAGGPPPQSLMESTDGGRTWHDIGARLP